jgi:Mg/Co/Ni transporter MgtE
MREQLERLIAASQWKHAVMIFADLPMPIQQKLLSMEGTVQQAAVNLLKEIP